MDTDTTLDRLTPRGTALVCGAGGVTGIAWMFGLVAGLAARGVDLRAARVLHGTSAGAVVAAELAHGVDPQERLDRELAGPGIECVPGPEVSAARRREIVAARLSADTWPRSGPRLQLVAATADPTCGWLLGADSGPHLVDALTASCAVPDLWPPHPLCCPAVPGRPLPDGSLLDDDRPRDFLDGGIRSLANIDLVDRRPLAVGREVHELRPAGLSPALAGGRDEVEHIILITPMRPRRAETADPRIREVVAPDRDAVRVMRPRPLDPSLRAAAAAAGKAQAEAISADRIAALREVVGDLP